MNKNKQVIRSPSPRTSSQSIPQTALVWFHSPPSTQIGVYKAIFPSGTQPTSYLSELKALQGGLEEGRNWAMFMVAGGHFAGAIVRVSRPEEEEVAAQESQRNKKRKKPLPDTEVLKHKTFHRYTSPCSPSTNFPHIYSLPARRKQGGSQSLNDNAKGNAKSAGAQLRRYGEQALREVAKSVFSL